VKSSILADALKRANIRQFLPSRLDRHKLGDAAEALLIFALIKDIMSMEEMVIILNKEKTIQIGFTEILKKIMKKIQIEKGK
jgi:hypothetical protein